MKKGQTVFRGRGFISQGAEPFAYVEKAVATDIVSDGVVLVRISAYSGPRLEPSTGWHEDERDAWGDAITAMNAALSRLNEMAAAKRVEIEAKMLAGVPA